MEAYLAQAEAVMGSRRVYNGTPGPFAEAG
jgi:hypothetical protein